MAVDIDGIDISHWQDGNIDYAAAKAAGVKFIYHKATEGRTYSDPNYARRRAEAKKAGIPFGAYHFARPNFNSAKDEARRFLKVADPEPGDMIPVLDLEVNEKKMSRAALTRWVGNFLEVFHRKGIKVMIYTPFDLNKTFGAPLWVARYNNAMLAPRVPSPWKTWDVWQFSDGVYGKPNFAPGVGKVDLNTLNTGVTVKELRIPKPVEKTELDIWHFSMQYSDNDAQHMHDVSVAFAQGADIITGTEAGPGAGNLTEALKVQAKASGYWIHIPVRATDCWIAVKKTLSPSKPQVGYIKILPGAKAIGDPHPYSSRGIVWAKFNSPDIGKVAVGSVHLLTKGRYKGQSQKDNPKCPIDHYTKNIEFGRAITKWANEQAEGSRLVFIGGDTNLIDRDVDVFRSAGNLKTCWDDKGEWPNTGHGNIDVIARHVDDRRVKFRSADVQDDKELFMHTDHFAIHATYTVNNI